MDNSLLSLPDPPGALLHHLLSRPLWVHGQGHGMEGWRWRPAAAQANTRILGRAHALLGTRAQQKSRPAALGGISE